MEVPSNETDRFLPAVRLASIEALGQRLGDEFYAEAMRQITSRPQRLVPIERQEQIEVSRLPEAHGIYNTLRYWFTDQLAAGTNEPRE